MLVRRYGVEGKEGDAYQRVFVGNDRIRCCAKLGSDPCQRKTAPKGNVGEPELMIARIWHGVVPASKSAEYLELMQKFAIRDYTATPGNRGAWCLHRTQGDVTHFLNLTFWDDFDAIKRFAGKDYGRARYYDFDPDYLIEMEPHVQHYEIG
jgi:hypothetical protein